MEFRDPMRLFFPLCVVLSVQIPGSVEFVLAASPVLTKQSDLCTESCKGRARIAISSREPRPGDSMTVDVRFENLGREQQFFNPFFRPLIPVPARLALFDSERRYVGDLFRVVGGSQRTPTSDDWVTIPYRGSVGFVRVAGLVDVSQDPLSGLRKMSSGRHYLQLIFHSRFASAPQWKPITLPDAARLNLPALSDEDFQELRRRLASFPSPEFDVAAWAERYRDDDLFRSNVIEFDFVREDAD